MTRKELMRLMPVNGDDLTAANHILGIGFPAIAPVMADMVRWMRVAESPVADAFAAFFARLDQPAVAVIAEGLMRENCWLRHRVFTQVLPHWSRGAIHQLSNVLTVIATQPDAYDNDLLCMEILAEHRLADPEWLRQWLAFKKERWTTRKDWLLRVEERVKGIQH